MRDCLNARTAPGGPEFEHHHFPFQFVPAQFYCRWALQGFGELQRGWNLSDFRTFLVGDGKTMGHKKAGERKSDEENSETFVHWSKRIQFSSKLTELDQSTAACSAGVLACEFRRRPGARNNCRLIVWRRDAADTRSRDGCATFRCVNPGLFIKTFFRDSKCHSDPAPA